MSDRLPAPWPRRFRWLGGSLTLLAALAVARWDIIDSPPYYDFALGLFTEANYLVETDFDYYRLRYFEKVGNDGGPRVYMTRQGRLEPLATSYTRSTSSGSTWPSA
jgi:hypothetical protein